MNLPPPPLDLSLGRLLKDTSQAILQRTDPAALMAYHPGSGSLAQRAAGAVWLEPCLGPVDPDRILVAPGAQTALAALLTLLTHPGDALVVEPLTYPGALALAAHLGLRLIPCPVDDEGMAPEALERLCAEQRPRAIYLIPTQQNPVATTMGLARRRQIAAIAAKAGVPIIEDDAYGRLPVSPLPALASLTPDNAWHVATTAKALSPGLRTAFIAAPDAQAAQRLGQALRAMSLMASPLTTAIATAWIREGTAERLLATVRAEAAARQILAREILPAAVGGAEGVHVWLDLPRGVDAEALRDSAAQRGLALVTAGAFAAGPVIRDGLRISLGGPARREVLAQALRGVAALLAAR